MLKLSRAILKLSHRKLGNLVYVRNSFSKLDHLSSLFCKNNVWHVVPETMNKRDDALRYIHHVVTIDNLPTEVKKLE